MRNVILKTAGETACEFSPRELTARVSSEYFMYAQLKIFWNSLVTLTLCMNTSKIYRVLLYSLNST